MPFDIIPSLAVVAGYLEKHFPKREFATKFDNVFYNKSCNKLMLVTNRRLVAVDVKKLNEKIMRINNDIAYYNGTLEKEMPKEPEKKKFIDIIRGIFR